jgi:formamidopyrimidine-DNA glycosylase
MPELPEVETVRRGLAPHLEGRRITGVVLNRPNLRLPFPERLAERITGAGILPLERRAKYLLVPLDSGETLVLHLGMSGRLLVVHEARADAPGRFHYKTGPVAPDLHSSAPGGSRLVQHDHAEITLEGGSKLVFNDPRRFGFLLLAQSAALHEHAALKGLGVEPLGNDFSEAALMAMLKGRKTPIKLALLDQRLIAGLGNIYVCEALFRAGIHPARAAGTLPAKEIARLCPAIRAVLEAAIVAGGSTLRDFRHEDGALGYFQHSFAVYGREGEPCPTCARPIARMAQGGRSSFFCTSCQRI